MSVIYVLVVVALFVRYDSIDAVSLESSYRSVTFFLRANLQMVQASSSTSTELSKKDQLTRLHWSLACESSGRLGSTSRAASLDVHDRALPTSGRVSRIRLHKGCLARLGVSVCLLADSETIMHAKHHASLVHFPLSDSERKCFCGAWTVSHRLERRDKSFNPPVPVLTSLINIDLAITVLKSRDYWTTELK
ncbi:hypothetical protein EV363DRAFT_1515486 [Boletus edulis]|nr:hypothetical protein EV363DRAFT_1515486 [Boletus edulis]